MQLLDALGVRWVTYEDYEADDIVATLATRAEEAGHEALIVTSDRDAIQLVDEKVTLLQPIKGVTEMRRMTPHGRRGEVRHPAGALSRPGGPGGRGGRQPPGRARRRPEDRREVDRPVRRPARRARPRRRDQGQGRPAAARPRRGRRAQPTDERRLHHPGPPHRRGALRPGQGRPRPRARGVRRPRVWRHHPPRSAGRSAGRVRGRGRRRGGGAGRRGPRHPGRRHRAAAAGHGRRRARPRCRRGCARRCADRTGDPRSRRMSFSWGGWIPRPPRRWPPPSRTPPRSGSPMPRRSAPGWR